MIYTIDSGTTVGEDGWVVKTGGVFQANDLVVCTRALDGEAEQEAAFYAQFIIDGVNP